MNNLKDKIQIAEKRYEEMEARMIEFKEDYKRTGNKLSLELAKQEQKNMDNLITSIMQAKRNLV